ncbi:MAG: hypothetical protein ACREQ2_24020 [Candidatus Binatia bacterium]
MFFPHLIVPQAHSDSSGDKLPRLDLTILDLKVALAFLLQWVYESFLKIDDSDGIVKVVKEIYMAEDE